MEDIKFKMQTLNIAVCDDEDKYSDQIFDIINKYLSDKNIESRIFRFDNGYSLIDSDISEYDIIFLDMDMPEISGMKTALCMREKGYEGRIVFVTVMLDMATEGYKVNAFRYILKGKHFKDGLAECLDAFLTENKINNTAISIDSAEGAFEVSSADIVYINYIKRKFVYYIYDKGMLKVCESKQRSSMSDYLYLSDYDIVMINRNTYVNLKYVNGIYRYGIELVNGLGKLELAQTQYNDFKKVFMKYWGKKYDR